MFMICQRCRPGNMRDTCVSPSTPTTSGSSLSTPKARSRSTASSSTRAARSLAKGSRWRRPTTASGRFTSSRNASHATTIGALRFGVSPRPYPLFRIQCPVRVLSRPGDLHIPASEQEREQRGGEGGPEGETGGDERGADGELAAGPAGDGEG